jgi:predicted  nucleic acid-binding Zn-ribbon protein
LTNLRETVASKESKFDLVVKGSLTPISQLDGDLQDALQDSASKKNQLEKLQQEHAKSSGQQDASNKERSTLKSELEKLQAEIIGLTEKQSSLNEREVEYQQKIHSKNGKLIA